MAIHSVSPNPEWTMQAKNEGLPCVIELNNTSYLKNINFEPVNLTFWSNFLSEATSLFPHPAGSSTAMAHPSSPADKHLTAPLVCNKQQSPKATPW